MLPKSDFPGTGPTGNGILLNIKSQGQWISSVVNTDGCTGCHQMGDKATREIPQSILSQTANSKAAWDLRIKAGQAGGGMSTRFDQRTDALGKTGASVLLIHSANKSSGAPRCR